MHPKFIKKSMKKSTPFLIDFWLILRSKMAPETLPKYPKKHWKKWAKITSKNEPIYESASSPSGVNLWAHRNGKRGFLDADGFHKTSVVPQFSIRFHSDYIQISFRFHKISLRFHADFIQISPRFHSDFTQISVRFHLDFTQIFWGPREGHGHP